MKTVQCQNVFKPVKNDKTAHITLKKCVKLTKYFISIFRRKNPVHYPAPCANARRRQTLVEGATIATYGHSTTSSLATKWIILSNADVRSRKLWIPRIVTQHCMKNLRSMTSCQVNDLHLPMPVLLTVKPVPVAMS